MLNFAVSFSFLRFPIKQTKRQGFVGGEYEESKGA